MVDDRVEGHIFALEVSLSRLHVVGTMVALNEALKLTIHNGAMSQGTFLTWKFKLQRSGCWNFRHTRSGIQMSEKQNKKQNAQGSITAFI